MNVKVRALSDATPSRSTDTGTELPTPFACFGTFTSTVVSLMLRAFAFWGPKYTRSFFPARFLPLSVTRSPFQPLADERASRCGALEATEIERLSTELFPVQSVAVKVTSCEPSSSTDGVQRNMPCAESAAPTGRFADAKRTVAPSGSFAASGIESGWPSVTVRSAGGSRAGGAPLGASSTLITTVSLSRLPSGSVAENCTETSRKPPQPTVSRGGRHSKSPLAESDAPSGSGVALHETASPSGSVAESWTRRVSFSRTLCGPIGAITGGPPGGARARQLTVATYSLICFWLVGLNQVTFGSIVGDMMPPSVLWLAPRLWPISCATIRRMNESLCRKNCSTPKWKSVHALAIQARPTMLPSKSRPEKSWASSVEVATSARKLLRNWSSRMPESVLV